jgi:hypothetical protein
VVQAHVQIRTDAEPDARSAVTGLVEARHLAARASPAVRLKTRRPLLPAHLAEHPARWTIYTITPSAVNA